MGVRHRLQRRECFRRDDEERLRGIEIADCLDKVGAVDVRYKAKRHCPVGVVLQSLIGHDRPEVGTTDANVDHVTNTLAGVALPLAAAHAVGEIRHAVEHGMDLGHDVFAIHDDGGVLRCAQAPCAKPPAFR